MRSGATPAPRAPSTVEARLERLARDKSFLELVVRLMGRVSAASEVEALVEGLLTGLVDVIGGTNLTLAWRGAGHWEVADLMGRREHRERLDDPELEAVMATQASREHPGAAHPSLAHGPSYTWLVPLVAAGEVVGAMRLEDVGLSMRELEAYLPMAFEHFALALKNALHRDQELAQVSTRLLDERVERARAEHTSRHARSLLEASLDPLVAISPQGQITDVNRATEEVTGVPRDRLLGTDFAQYFTEPDRAHAGYRQALEEGSARDLDLTLRHADGHTTEVVYNAAIYRDASGALQGVFAAARDVSHRRRAEALQRELDARNRRAERAAAVGTLAAGMAHEVNNPLTFVVSGVAFALEQLRHLPAAAREAWRAAGGDPAETESALREASQGAARVAALVTDLRVLANAQHAEAARAELAPALDRAFSVARHALVPGTVVNRALPPLPPVQGTEAELVQLFACLLVNALQAGGERPNQVDVSAALERGQVVVRVADSGRGIPPEDLARVFDPFFTTRGVGQGKGLGLPVARGIALGLGGDLEIQSTPGVGTTVTVTLPALPGPEAAAGVRGAVAGGPTSR